MVRVAAKTMLVIHAAVHVVVVTRWTSHVAVRVHVAIALNVAVAGMMSLGMLAAHVPHDGVLTAGTMRTTLGGVS